MRNNAFFATGDNRLWTKITTTIFIFQYAKTCRKYHWKRITSVFAFQMIQTGTYTLYFYRKVQKLNNCANFLTFWLLFGDFVACCFVLFY